MGTLKMSRIRWELTAREHVEYSLRTEQLVAIGFDVQVPQRLSPAPDVDLEIGYAPDFLNIVFDLAPWRVVLVTGIKLVARRSGIYINDDVQITLPWGGHDFELWSVGDEEDRPCRLFRELCIDRNQVLNHRLEGGIRLQRGEVITGLLVAVALRTQVPSQHAHGALVKTSITFRDSLGTPFSAAGAVHVDRRIAISKPAGIHRKGNLFERPILATGRAELCQTKRPVMPESGGEADEEAR